MSVSPPTINQFADCLVKEITSVNISVYQLQRANEGTLEEKRASQIVFNVIKQVCADLDEGLKSKDFAHLNSKAIRELTFLSSESIRRIKNSMQTHHSQLGENAENLSRPIETLEKLLISFQQLLSHKDEISQNTLEKYLLAGESWALTEFISLIRSKNLWAEEKLAQYAAEKQPFVLKILLHETPNMDIIVAYKDIPGLREGVIELLDRYNSTSCQKRGSALLSALIENSSEKWAQTFLIEVIKRPCSDLIEQCLSKLWKGETVLSSWFQEEIFKGFCKEQDWAITTLCQLLKYGNQNLIRLITSKLLILADGQIALQQTLLCIGAILTSNRSFHSYLLNAIDEGKFCNACYPNKELVLESLKRLQQFQETLKANNDESSETSFTLQYHACLMVLKREQRLRDVLIGDADLNQYQSLSVSDSFPKVSQILLGGSLNDAGDALKPEMMEVAQFLAKEKVECVCPSVYWKHLMHRPSNVKTLLGSTWLSKWVRDTCFALESGMRLPNFICSTTDENKFWLLEARENRIKESSKAKYKDLLLFEPLGMVYDQFRQYDMLSYLLGEGGSLDQFHNLCFTYNEGGNCLIGEANGKPYALIGKDTVALNLKFLKKEIAQLGLKKIKDNKWTKGMPYAPEECELNEDDLRLFFGLDLGISPKNIHFVEQPEYHLDVSMAILNERTVVVNDSMQALEVWKNYAEQRKSIPGFIYNEKRYNNRLKVLGDRAKSLKQHEDISASELTQLGFNVIRIGGAFNDLFEDEPKNHQTNLFNFLTFTSPINHRNIIGLDCEPFFKQHFEKMIDEYVPKVDQIHYLDRTASRNLLALDGGVHCMMRPLAKSA